MEFALKWMYSVESELEMPYQDNLQSLMNSRLRSLSTLIFISISISSALPQWMAGSVRKLMSFQIY